MSDRRFVVLLIGALVACTGIGIILLAAFGLQTPVYRDLDTGAVRDMSRTLVGLIVLGAILLVGGLGTSVTLLRLHLRR